MNTRYEIIKTYDLNNLVKKLNNLAKLGFYPTEQIFTVTIEGRIYYHQLIGACLEDYNKNKEEILKELN